jgi:hypothetical protein
MRLSSVLAELPGRIILWTLGGYLVANVSSFVFDPFSSPWHYYDHKPVLVPVERAKDQSLSLNQIRAVLDEIDLAYRGRKPTKSEQTVLSIKKAVSIFFSG